MRTSSNKGYQRINQIKMKALADQIRRCLCGTSLTGGGFIVSHRRMRSTHQYRYAATLSPPELPIRLLSGCTPPLVNCF
jgi:hypothetical protein